MYPELPKPQLLLVEGHRWSRNRLHEKDRRVPTAEEIHHFLSYYPSILVIRM